MNRADAAGRLLAERHRRRVEPDPDRSLVNYAESARTGDWSLRSALVRLAQPEPVRAAAVLELVRRTDAALQPLARTLERATVTCDRALGLDLVTDAGDGWELADPSEPYPDARMADLARLVYASRGRPGEADRLVVAYVAASEPDAPADEELGALALLDVALHLDALADVLTSWANAGPADPPLDQVDATCRQVRTRLDELGVPRETGPPPRAASRG